MGVYFNIALGFICYRSFLTGVAMVVFPDPIECFVSQSFQIYLQNTFRHVLAAGFTVIGLKDRCVVRVQSLHRSPCRKEEFYTKSEKSMTTSVKSLDPTVKVSWTYLVPFGCVRFGSSVTRKLTRGPRTRIRPRRLSLPEFPSLAQNFRPVELTQA